MNDPAGNLVRVLGVVAAAIGACILLANAVTKDPRIRSPWARKATVLAAVLVLVWCAGTVLLIFRPSAAPALLLAKTAIGGVGAGIIITLFISRSFAWRFPDQHEKPNARLGAAPNGGPAKPQDSSGAPQGPPSVSQALAGSEKMKLVGHVQWLLPAVLLVAVSVAVWHWKRAHGPMAFVNHWGELFRQHPTPEAFHQLAVLERPDLIYLRTFQNGEWVAARGECPCTDGGGFDATVFLDSHGVIRFQVGHHFCGYEGLSSELREIKADTVADFYTRMTDVRVRIWGVNPATRLR